MRPGPWLAAMVLAGCAAGAPVDRSVAVSGARFAGVQGEATTIVRTHLLGTDGQRREVLGASCGLTSSLFETAFTTPAEVHLPNFGPQSPELQIACRAGDMQGMATTRIVTSWRYPPGAFGGFSRRGRFGYWDDWPGLYGPAIAVSDYPDISVEVR